jgi:hypothetical protein
MLVSRFARAELRVLAILALLVAAFATREPVLLAGYVLAALIVIVANARIMSALGGREAVAGSLLVIAALLTLPVTLIRNPNVLIHGIIVTVSFGAAYVLTRDFRAYARASWIILVASQAYVIVYLMNAGLGDFPLERLLPESSSNVVTSFLIVLQANACACTYLLSRRTSVMTAIVTLGICIVGYGRGSLLVAAMLVTVCTLGAAGGSSWAKTINRVLVVFSIGLLAYFHYQSEIHDFVAANTKIGAGLYDEPRHEIIQDYIEKIDDAASLFFGADYRGTSIESTYFGNPHNSYIRAHNIFGLPYLICMLLLPFLFDRRQWSGGSRIFVYAMIALMLIRGITEPLLFPTLFDFFYFALCFALAQPSTRTSCTFALPLLKHESNRSP